MNHNPKYEYKMLTGSDPDERPYETIGLDILNDLGQQGWEVVSAAWGHAGGVACLTGVILKRPLS